MTVGKMKCNFCKYNRRYILGPDECGAGSYAYFCAKGHWENAPHEDLEQEKTTQEIVDHFENCNDFAERIEKISKKR